MKALDSFLFCSIFSSLIVGNSSVTIVLGSSFISVVTLLILIVWSFSSLLVSLIRSSLVYVFVLSVIFNRPTLRSYIFIIVSVNSVFLI